VRTWAPPGSGIADIRRVVAAAERHGQRVALVLGDGSGDCIAPAPAATGRADWYRSGYQSSLMPWIRELVPQLRDEPAVAMWELAPPPPAEVSAPEVRRFYDTAGAEVHRLDRNHLVASGSGGPTAGALGDWTSEHESPQIDVTTMVDYDMNAGPAAELDDAVGAAATLGKPLVVTEAGVYGSPAGDPAEAFDPARASDTSCVDWSSRVSKLRAKFDATLATPVAGVNVLRTVRPQGAGPAAACAVAVTSADDPLLAVVHNYAVSGGSPTPPAPPAGEPSPSDGDSPSPEASTLLSTSTPPALTPSPEVPPQATATTQPPPPLPAVPSGLTGRAGNGEVTLCWSKAANAAWYSVFYRDATNGEQWQRMKYPVQDTCWTGQLYINGHRYDFKIRGAGPNGESGDSNVVSVTPAAPRPAAVTGLTGEGGNGTVKLCWSKAANATGYNVYYRDVTQGQAWTLMPYPIADTCWTGNLYTNGHTYALKVRGANGDGEGPDSNVVTVVPHA
jgi:hypothetical protein